MKRHSLLSFFIAFILLGFMASCEALHRVEGNNSPSVEQRSLESFSKVEVNGSLNVSVYEDSVCEVEVEAESNLLQYIQTYVYNDKLYVEIADGVNLSENLPISVRVYTPYVNYLCLNGSGSIRSNNLFGSEVRTEINGSGEIISEVSADHLRSEIDGSGSTKLSGFVNHSTLNIEGSGRILAGALESDSCYAKISGSGKMNLNVIKYLNARIAGSGEIWYQGFPSTSVDIDGSGIVSHP